MFERYTEKTRRVIFVARYEASEFGSPYIESEHLLLGLLREGKSLYKLFPEPNTALATIRRHIEEHTTVRCKIPTSVDLPVSGECQRILLHASDEADRMAHRHVGTEHLLLGMFGEQNSYAAQLLNENGVGLDKARALLGGESPEFPVH